MDYLLNKIISWKDYNKRFRIEILIEKIGNIFGTNILNNGVYNNINIYYGEILYNTLKKINKYNDYEKNLLKYYNKTKNNEYEYIIDFKRKIINCIYANRIIKNGNNIEDIIFILNNVRPTMNCIITYVCKEIIKDKRIYKKNIFKKIIKESTNNEWLIIKKYMTNDIIEIYKKEDIEYVSCIMERDRVYNYFNKKIENNNGSLDVYIIMEKKIIDILQLKKELRNEIEKINKEKNIFSLEKIVKIFNKKIIEYFNTFDTIRDTLEYDIINTILSNIDPKYLNIFFSFLEIPNIHNIGNDKRDIFDDMYFYLKIQNSFISKLKFFEFLLF